MCERRQSKCRIVCLCQFLFNFFPKLVSTSKLRPIKSCIYSLYLHNPVAFQMMLSRGQHYPEAAKAMRSLQLSDFFFQSILKLRMYTGFALRCKTSVIELGIITCFSLF
ncbi:hypothetical protein EDC96DRAFT_514054 [Choanephora cucurbitarum]|nr:hypothetical protein EDC96DRAFT_514054 [Choanephora cucurbitarum]